ncbi:MAG TPA: M23 family metallopeptidase [Desulfobacteraceae bacterium]|nr:M23 family metallopeptidase [Deltaproteobacteria bacterium]MBW2355849.1 M23 family metallopeptidase [Deltaproteobacteria bacterium]HDI58819.1 M23 family metallopeptidase [Desulfobacteraceae bacterium]
MKKGKSQAKWILVLAAVVTLAGAGGWTFMTRLEGAAPVVRIDPPFSAVGAERAFTVEAEDTGSGLRSLSVSLLQGEKTVVLLGRRLDAAAGEGRVRETLRLAAGEHGLSDGPALLRVEARDRSWRHWGKGNPVRMERQVRIDLRPPVLQVLSGTLNINQGGCGLVIYRSSEPCPVSGVTVGDSFYPAQGGLFEDPLIMATFVALAYDQGKGTPITVSAEDEAGNQARIGLNHFIRPRRWRQDTLEITDGFLTAILPGFTASIPDAAARPPLDQFLWVNRELRKANYEKIVELTRTSDNRLHWHDAFVRLPAAASRAMFADQRVYRYRGQEIDRQVHMGVDLASLAASPVPAGNRGRVVFADDLGIYGKTVILDHGFGLFSMYSHLSQIGVHAGQPVQRSAVIGRTGSTGLAGGDHLHYAMMVGATFINPIEWWDDHWIKDNVTDKIAAAGATAKTGD